MVSVRLVVEVRRRRQFLSLPVALTIVSCVTPPKASPPAAPAGTPVVISLPAPPTPPTRAPGAAVGRQAVSAPSADSAALYTPPPIDREFRAVWVTPLGAGTRPDWPSAPGLSADSQRAELRALLDRAKAIGLNAVILHVRTAADALYPTSLVPWSPFLSGRVGVAPSPAYDPLAYAVAQAHARGLQLHAWFNPFRALLPNFAHVPPSHVTRSHPSWIRKYGKQTWIDPGEPAARAAAVAAILDVVRRYDVDGVHIDDYFYPYRETRTIHRRAHHRRVTIQREIAFPDDRTWKRYGRSKGWTDRAAWRRANIDDFVERLYHAVKSTKPWVLVGISPFGIWKSGTPPGVTGLDAYGEIYADSRRWLREGWLDYIVPQLYWPIEGNEHRFTRLDAWWRAQNVRGRHIWPGIETEQTLDERDPWSPQEIADQIDTLRDEQLRGALPDPGHVHFKLAALELRPLLGGGSTSLGERLRSWVYPRPALVPASPWLDPRVPAAPRVTAESVHPAAVRVSAADSVGVRWWVVETRSAGGGWTVRVEPASTTSLALSPPNDPGVGNVTSVAVAAVSRTGMVSALTIVNDAVAGGAGGAP